MPINMNQKLLLATFVAEAAANQSIHRSIAWRRLVKKAKLWQTKVDRILGLQA